MNDINLLNNNKKNYDEMISTINRVIQMLNYSINELGDASKNFSPNYLIDSERADGNSIEVYKNNLISQVDWLKNTILPAIEKSISSCDLQIDKLLAAAATVVTTPIINTSITSVAEAPSNNQNVETPKVNVTTPTVKQSTKITSNTPVNKMKTKTIVKSSNLKILKKVTTSTVNSIKSKLRSLFK